MKVEVQYDVPVSALVNVETGEVEKVLVWRDSAEPRDGDYAGEAVKTDDIGATHGEEGSR